MLAAMLLLGACGQPEPTTSAAPAQQAGQLVVQRDNVPDYKTVSAVLTSRDVGDARARIGGTLSRLLVREGDSVRRGQVLAIISDQRLALEAQAGAAGVAAAEAASNRFTAKNAKIFANFAKIARVFFSCFALFIKTYFFFDNFLQIFFSDFDFFNVFYRIEKARNISVKEIV
jgi:multidrug efflux pump subunit AcrA (membrane-fusion protein)